MSVRQKVRMSLEAVEECLVPEVIDHTSALIDMGETQAQTMSINKQIAEIVNDTQTLDNIAGIIETNQEIGLNPQSAEVVSLVTESIYAKYGIKAKATPGSESFTDTSKAIFTKIAHESIKEGLQKLWNLIVAAVKTAYNTVVEFIKKIFNAAKGIRQKAEKMTETVKTLILTDKRNQETISNAEDIATEDMEGSRQKTLSNSAITLIFADKTDAPSVFRTTDALKKTLAQMPTMFETVDKAVKITQTLVKEFGDKVSVDNISFPTFTHGLQASDEDGKYHSEMFPGGMALIVKGLKDGVNPKGLEAISAMRNTSIYIGPWNPKQAKEHHKSIPVLNRPSIDQLLEDAIAISTTVEKLNGQASKLQLDFKALTNDVSEFSVTAEDPTTEMKQALSDLKGVITSIKNICSAGLPSVMSYSLRVSNALVDYCHVSLMCYDKPKVA